jgi:hypothetical protein
MKMSNPYGQNMLQYILLLTIIIVTLITFLGPNGFYTTRLNRAFEHSINGVNAVLSQVNYTNY